MFNVAFWLSEYFLQRALGRPGMGEIFAVMGGKSSLAVAVLGLVASLSACAVHGAGTAGSRAAFVAQGPMAGRPFWDSASCVGRPPQRLLGGDRVGGEAGGILVHGTSRRGRAGITGISMSKKDRRYKLAKRGQSEDELLLTVAEQFRRREGQASISWYPGHIAKAEKALQEVRWLESPEFSTLQSNLLMPSTLKELHGGT